MSTGATRHAERPEWMLDAPEATARGRVVRPEDALVRIVDLPSVEELAEHDEEPTEAELSAETSGGAAVTWALGYRNGFDSGLAEGRSEGLAAGRREGLERATSEAVTRYERILRDLQHEAADHLEQLRSLTDAGASQATELAFELAREVLGRELALAEDPGADAVRRALAALPGCADATARLHPDDLARLGVRAEQLAPGTAVQLIADPSLSPGDCVLSSGASTVDAGIGAALARVRAALDLPAGNAGEETAR